MADSTDIARDLPSPTPAPMQGMARTFGGADRQPEYRPLALLSVIGLGVAIVYTLAMAVGSIIALFQGRPWLLGPWTAIFPLGAAALSLIGFLQIQRSEGTLGGRRLALTGMALPLGVGLVYWSYVLATFLAIRHQADLYGREFISRLQNQETLTAYWMTLPPEVRPVRPSQAETDPAFRKTLEDRFNQGNESTLSRFEHGDTVHTLRQLDSSATVESTGVVDWEFTKDGYVMHQGYRITTSEGTFEVVVNTQGRYAKHGEFVGRQWYVVIEKTAIRGEPVFTNQGQERMFLRSMSRHVAEGWLAKLTAGRVAEAFVDTRPPDEQEVVRPALLGRYAALDCMALAISPDHPTLGPLCVLRALIDDPSSVPAPDLKGLKEFAEGSLVQYDRVKFWVPCQGTPGTAEYQERFEKKQDEVAGQVKALFAKPGPDWATTVRLERGGFMPLTVVENGRFEVRHTCTFALADAKTGVEGDLVVSCDLGDSVKAAASTWRIDRIELRRAVMVPPSRMLRRPGVGPPGAPPGGPPPGGGFPGGGPPGGGIPGGGTPGS
jgi:hypothetical protein